MRGARFITLLTTPFPFFLHRPHHLPSILHLTRHYRPPSSPHLAPLSTSYCLLTLSPASRPLSFPVKAIHTQTSNNQEDVDAPGFLSNSPAAHPWPEWSRLIDSISSAGYFYLQRRSILVDDEFVASEDFPDEFVCASNACLAFARHRSDLLGLLSRRDIGVVVDNGTAFLFKSASDTARRMRAFIGNCAGNELDSNKAQTVDLMMYLLSYVSKSLAKSNLQTGELIESAVRNILSECTRLSSGVLAPESFASVEHQFGDRYGQTPRPLGQNMEMKRGDWICPRCTFMNFARNVKCLKCEEARPNKQLIGREWECPQCDFFNYGKNLACLRCDCKRPGDTSFGITNSSSVFGHGNDLYANGPHIESRLAANEENVEGWFSKVSQLDSTSGLVDAAADGEFSEIIPLRRGVNQFVVSTSKTPLECRLADSQFQREAANTCSSEFFCHTSTVSNGHKINVGNEQNAGTASSSMSISTFPQFRHPKGSHSSYVPFVPLPNEMFAKDPEKIEENERVVAETMHSASLKATEQTRAVSMSSETGKSVDSLLLTEKPSNEVEKSENWFKKVADLHDATDLKSGIADDFPEIIPKRKGENRFVVSKKNAPIYKRRMAMEESCGTANFVPFVPFTPVYFAKKGNQQPNGADSTVKATSETYPDSGINKVYEMDNPQTSMRRLNSELSGENLNERKTRDTYGSPISGSPTHNSFVSQSNDTEDGLSKQNGLNIGFSGKNLNERKSHITYGSPISGKPTQNSFDSLRNTQDGRNIGFSVKESRVSTGFSGNEGRIGSTDLSGNSTKQPENLSVRSGWTGKSLEGSAVQESDPFDMSEEAKAQRWFRRVAQIKDISELSQIPDEDFPSIMPMRKGVNRFVVSKRKTPLERRLTSPQYRRNLPVVSSDSLKKENENS